MVDVGSLRAIRAIAESGSISAASRQLGMSQPGLSRLVERVETELSTSLFARGRNGAEITSDGERVLKFATDTLAAYDELLAALGAAQRNGVERVRVVASTTPGEYLLPMIAGNFTQNRTNVSVETLIVDSGAVAEHLLSRSYDVGFTGANSGTPGLAFLPVAQDEIVLAVPFGHRFADRTEIEAKSLADERLLWRERGSGTYETVVQALGKRGHAIKNEYSYVSLGSTQALLSAVNSGLGIGFVTLRAIEHFAASRVVPVRIAGGSITRDLFLVFETHRKFGHAILRFINYVREWARKNREFIPQEPGT
jgi:DNA-binding transcriptional LysR family regulator